MFVQLAQLVARLKSKTNPKTQTKYTEAGSCLDLTPHDYSPA
jgi:hypothetical protein